MSRFEPAYDPDRRGQILLRGGAPVAEVFWAHDFVERAQTGWFLALLNADGEPDREPARRLDVSDDVAQLVADARLDRAQWVAHAETVELVTAAAAVQAAGRRLLEALGPDDR